MAIKPAFDSAGSQTGGFGFDGTTVAFHGQGTALTTGIYTVTPAGASLSLIADSVHPYAAAGASVNSFGTPMVSGVNVVASGTGGAVASTITDSGALSITTDTTAHDAGGSISRTATSTLTGTGITLTTGTGSVGTGSGANALNLAAGQTGVVVTTHTATGEVFLTDAGSLTLGAITTTGGDVTVAPMASTTTPGFCLRAMRGASITNCLMLRPTVRASTILYMLLVYDDLK